MTQKSTSAAVFQETDGPRKCQTLENIENYVLGATADILLDENSDDSSRVRAMAQNLKQLGLLWPDTAAR